MRVHSKLIITIVGPESSGKSTLGKFLAKELQATFVPEYARAYLESLGRPYEFEDLEIIAQRQLESEHSAVGSRQSSVFSSQSSVRSLQSSVLSLQSVVGHSSLAEFITWLKSLNSEVIIIDAGMLTMRMWALIKYGKTIPLVEKFLEEDHTSLYILCKPRKEWEFDSLREAPELIDRVWIYNQYLKELVSANKNWVSIKPETLV